MGLGLCGLLYLTGLCGAFVFLTPEPGYRSGSSSTSRGIARGSVISCFILLAAQLAGGFVPSVRWTLGYPLIATHSALLAFGTGAAMWYAKGLAERARMPRLVNAAAAIFVIVLAAEPLLLMLLRPVPPGPIRGTWAAAAPTFAALLLVLVLAALIAGLVFCTRFNIVLGTIIRHRENDADH